MPDEKNSAPVAPAPEQATAPAPQAPATVAPATPAKKSNAGVIILVVILVIVIIGGGISYGIYRFVKNRVQNAVSDVVNNAGGNIDTTNVGNDVNSYSAVKDITPTDSLSKTIDASVKPIISNLFGGAKLSLWSSTPDGGMLTYTTKNSISSSDYANLETAFVKAGYTAQGNYASGDAFVATFDKGDNSIYVTSSGTNTISILISKITPTDTSASQ